VGTWERSSESDGSKDRDGRSDPAREDLGDGEHIGYGRGASTNRYEHAIRVDDDLLNRKTGWEQG
jgi:hypothetical protein